MISRNGMAIVMVLIVLLLVEGMAAGMLALATHTRATSAAQLRSARAEAAAYLAARAVLRNWNGTGLDTLAVGGLASPPEGRGAEADATWSTTVERLRSEWIIRSEARVGSSALYSRSAVTALARTLDGAAMLAEFNAAAKSAGAVVIAGASSISATDSACAAATSAAALESATPPAVSPTVTLNGLVMVDSMLVWSDSTALTSASWSDVAAVADRTESGAVTPQPMMSGSLCDTTAVMNWGEPSPAGSACSSYFPLVYSPGDLTMMGGRGQGILVVAGVFTMMGNARFAGGIIARDGVSLGPDAEVLGAVISHRGYMLIQDALLTHSACSLQNAISATRASRRLLPERRRFLPVF